MAVTDKIQEKQTISKIQDEVEKLINIGIALSAEKDCGRLLERILDSAKELTNADGGTIYSRKDNALHFQIMKTDSLGLFRGGSSGRPIRLKPIKLFGENQEPNDKMVVSYAVINGVTINIADVYLVEENNFDFSGTRSFDKKTGYRSKSFLTVPLKNHENEIMGALQLLNAIDPVTNESVPFSAKDQRLVESLSSQAAVAITNSNLILELKNLFDAFIQLIASAIDEKSAYTGGHCRRVPKLTMMLADAAEQSKQGPFENFELSKDDRYELEIAAWLHDCGKITTPEYVVDKATKLETIYDRVKTIEIRSVALKRELEIQFLKQKIAAMEAGQPLPDEEKLAIELQRIDDELEFIQGANIGGESMTPAHIARVRDIAGRTWTGGNGETQPFLTDDEVYNLLIFKGTLTNEEREIINNHIVMTIAMLKALPFPKLLKRVPEYAGGHHEKMDGTGYPNMLTKDKLSIQARMLAIADIFEALTAKDRPYKKAKSLTESLLILGKMKQDNHIDPDLFDIFVKEKVYLRYAKEFLNDDQIDQVIHGNIPGYQPDAGGATQP